MKLLLLHLLSVSRPAALQEIRALLAVRKQLSGPQFFGCFQVILLLFASKDSESTYTYRSIFITVLNRDRSHKNKQVENHLNPVGNVLLCRTVH